MNSNHQTTLSATLWGIALFMIWGLALIFGEIPHEWEFPSWVQGVFFVATIALLPIGMCIGWIQSFPRWSYPYVGHVLVFSLYMMNVATPGFLFGRELWGWRAWIPFLIIACIAILVTRSFQPIIDFFVNIKNDWTRLTFGMFGFMPLLVAIGFDEMDRLYSLYSMVIITLLMSGAAWFYMRAETQQHRVIALLTGILLTTAITVIAPTLYWQRNGWVNPSGMAIMGGIVVLVMFSPALIGLVNHVVNNRGGRHVMD
jgi:hypothetical protein